MGRQERQNHQPEPWAQNGREILDATSWPLAVARFPDDARRIVAAVNAVQGIPTEALESWSTNVIGPPIAAADEEQPGEASETHPDDRRVGERRRGDRRASAQALAVFGAPPPPREEEGEKDSR